jgi:SHS2 domain-containing protein
MTRDAAVGGSGTLTGAIGAGGGGNPAPRWFRPSDSGLALCQSRAMGTFEILEHTADVGILARGDTVEEAFEQATLGLADIMGISQPGRGSPVAVEVAGDDLGSLLVDWLSEVLWLHDSRDALLGDVEVLSVQNGRAAGAVTLVPRGDAAVAGTQVKAITYHQLRVEKGPGGWTARVFVDV